MVTWCTFNSCLILLFNLHLKMGCRGPEVRSGVLKIVADMFLDRFKRNEMC